MKIALENDRLWVLEFGDRNFYYVTKPIYDNFIYVYMADGLTLDTDLPGDIELAKKEFYTFEEMFDYGLRGTNDQTYTHFTNDEYDFGEGSTIEEFYYLLKFCHKRLYEYNCNRGFNMKPSYEITIEEPKKG